MRTTSLYLHLAAVFTIAGFPDATTTARGQGTKESGAVIPLVEFREVPLDQAIGSLAKQTGLNYILDPNLSDPSPGSDGKLVSQPSVSVRWEKMTAKQALARLLDEHGLKTVENPATSVTRITNTNQPSRTVETSLLGRDTNGVIPVIQMVSAPLDVVLREIAAKAHLNVVFETKLPDFVPGRPWKPPRTIMVSIRWEKITARQALTALCENYNLVLAKDPATGVIRIKLKDE